MRAEYETNVVGVLNVAQAVLPQFRARRDGHILVVGSMSAHLSFLTFTVYALSKAAVRSLVEGFQMECESLGVKITLVELAGWMTKFFDNVKTAERIDGYDDTYARMQAIFHSSHLGDIAKSMGAIADITGIADPPKHLASGAAGVRPKRVCTTPVAGRSAVRTRAGARRPDRT